MEISRGPKCFTRMTQMASGMPSSGQSSCVTSSTSCAARTAQPPGKTLKTISLLSGGEKAFVAIALYFAILKVHPTPFCVMDEIEAALDDANVTRFARYMRTLADKTQFIVITHRRGTMEEADVLYGVTMQEQGVSKILTINLNDMAKELKVK